MKNVSLFLSYKPLKKVIYLFLALLLPGLIFVFLKYGGKNQFDVPVFHEQGVTPVSAGCQHPEEEPYVIPDSLWQLSGVSRSAPVVMIFTKGGINNKALEAAIGEELGEGSVSFLSEIGLTADSLLAAKWRKCVFMAFEPQQTVLVDSVGRIRGYYNVRSREEVDRLRLELKIILKRY